MSLSTAALVLPAAARAQAQPPGYTTHAALEHDNGMLKIHASSPWPVEQAFAAIRREYGLVLDYEQGPSSDPDQFVWQANRKMWKGGDFVLQVPEPDQHLEGYQKQLVLSLLSQFATHGGRVYVPIYGINGRISVAPERSSERILDTPITIPPERRTIDGTIQAIFSAIKTVTGSGIERAGLIDNETASKEVVVGNQTPVAARILLAEALDHASYKRVWVQTWDPETSTYALGIEPAVKLLNSAETPIR